MASNSFKVKNSLVLTPKDLATLVSPEAGDLACDINDSNKIKRYDVNSASWVEVGSGGGVGGTDIFFVQDFESASLASFTQTGLTLSQTDPLHGKVSALLTHQAAVNQSFKQVIPVDRKFRGESMTLRLNCKSSASAGNVTIKIYDETNAANIVASEQLQLANDVSGAISQVGFTIPATCASISYTITALPQSGSPVTRIDDVIAELAVTSLLETVVELTGNAQTLTIPLTQSGLVQEADSAFRITGSAGLASTNTKIVRFSTIRENTGADISYQSSATLGDSFTVLTSGIYEISAVLSTNGASFEGISKNSTQLTADISGINEADRIALGYNSTTGEAVSLSATVSLLAGDVIRAHAGANFNASAASFQMTRRGSLKQVSVSPDQKITIPTSELRFEGASTRGSTATAIVKFDTQAKLRGDAFTVESDSVLGTRITMKKAGKLDVSAAFQESATSNSFAITKNQSNLTIVPTTVSEVLIGAFENSAGQYIIPLATSTFVQVGDVIRIACSANPVSSTFANLNLSFQEQDISVSVTNTLPQFSESDSSVRVDTANGYGSFGTKIRRFSSVRDSIGVDVEYLDSATNGASFTVKSAGVYDISYSDDANAATVVGLSKNAPDLTLALSSLASINRLAISDIYTANARTCVSWQGYLAVGDVIRAHTQGIPSSNAAFASFTMSKVGKPNVTGVNVTPFVNVPQPENQSSFLSTSTNFGGGGIFLGALTSSKGSGLFSYNSSTGLYTVLKTGIFNLSCTSTNTAGAGVSPTIKINGNIVALDTTVTTASFYACASGSYDLVTGDTFNFSNVSAGANGQTYCKVLATALSDQILTAPETFSTDTAALTYANAATYTLSTLANAPVGTYITFTYAAATNTRTQTTLTNRPSQTDADMNANGIMLTSRVYAAPSTAALPSTVAVQIGKGLKGCSISAFAASAKAGSCSLDFLVESTGTTQEGIKFKDYDEKTGVLFLDAGFTQSSLINTNRLIRSDTLASTTTPYLVINASKNPALTGIGLNRVAARGVQSSGQSIPNSAVTTVTYDASKIFDTHGALNAATGVFTAPETGYYQASALITCGVSTLSGVAFQAAFYKNGVQYSLNDHRITATNIPLRAMSDLIFLSKGHTLDVRINQNSGSATALIASGTQNFFSITKVSV